MPSPKKWRIYYGDGSTFDGETTEDAFAAPVQNVQMVKHYADNDKQYALRHSMNFYCWQKRFQRWSGKGDLFGLSDYYFTEEGAQKVLIGREIPDDTYRIILLKASEEGAL